ncbi:hypothetical protein [Actinomadura sp. 9N407]|uniref:hypothetical protein n=1 Tax=Actinomadura sp. 9N407 TaxID=3375154 RepID=UPI0037BE1120
MATIDKPLDPTVCPCAARVAGRVFPVQRPARAFDERFSGALVREVGEALAAHGYPVIEDDSPDFYALMWCLWRYCYGHAGEPSDAGDVSRDHPGDGGGEGPAGSGGSGPLG